LYDAKVSERRVSTQIVDDLRKQIEEGKYAPGHQLPSVTALMTRYGVARQTVQNAIDQLRMEGVVTTRKGAGVFVHEQPHEEVARTEQRHVPGPHAVERVTSRFATAQDVAANPTLELGSLVFAITRTVHDANGDAGPVERTVISAGRRELVYELPAGPAPALPAT
jgi:DNA-binding transcriptional regulator YhcF (GntR family)